jgi:competence protein ComEA
MGWKQIAADYFSFTYKDRLAILLIFLVLAGIFLLPGVFKTAETNPAMADTIWIAALRRTEIKQPYPDNRYADNNDDNNSAAYQYDRPTGTNTTSTKGELFFFDPNTISTAEWLRLGIREKTVRTIQNYLAKGGKFRQPADVKRIYGLFPNEYERIASYIKIANTENPSGGYTDNRVATNPVVKTNTPRYSIIDVNTTDTSALIALPGIGSKLAARIINFRDKLGGFYAVSQVGETFGLPDSTFQKIKQYLKAEHGNIRKININTASVDQLKVHPYIKWAIANPLIAYRKEHGAFAKLDDLKKVMAVTDEVYAKIAPYLSVE